jgi:stress response protein YsnF
MVSEQEMSAAIGSTAYGSDGGKLGTVEAFFADDRTGAPTWVSISTGLFGTRHSVVPVSRATFTEGTLRLPVTADAVKSAPPMGGEHLDPADEEALRQHYGLESTPAKAVDAGPVDAGPVDTRPVPPVDAGPAETRPVPPVDAAGAMTRAEEQLRVGTERVATTRARLVKYVVTEEVQITVPIRREEIRVEEVPVDATDAGPQESLLADGESASYSAGPGLPDEIILHTERPVVTVEVVPTERVRLRVDTVEGQETVTGQVQREEIVVDQTPSSRITPR